MRVCVLAMLAKKKKGGGRGVGGGMREKSGECYNHTNDLQVDFPVSRNGLNDQIRLEHITCIVA